jgi:hypothetical protein
MLCGRLPFEGQPHQAMHAIARGEYPRPRSVFPELPPELEAVLVKGLQKERDARYATAELMREDLERYLTRVAPGFGQEKLKELMQYLYYDELAAEGVPLPKRAALEVNLSAWRDAPLISTDVSSRRDEAPEPVSPARLLLPVAGVVAVLLGVLVYRNLAAMPEERPPEALGPPPQIVAAQRPKAQQSATEVQVVGSERHAEVVITQGGSTVNLAALDMGSAAADALNQGNAAQAYSLAKSCLARDGADPECLYVGAAAAVRLGQPDEARRLLKKLVDVAPDHPKALRARRWLDEGGAL